MANPMEVYDKIKKISPQAEAEAQAFMGNLTNKYTEENPAPPETIQKGLEEIVAKHQPKAQGLAHARAPLGRIQYAAGLATVLIAVALASAGIPYVPPPLY